MVMKMMKSQVDTLVLVIQEKCIQRKSKSVQTMVFPWIHGISGSFQLCQASMGKGARFRRIGSVGRMIGPGNHSPYEMPGEALETNAP